MLLLFVLNIYCSTKYRRLYLVRSNITYFAVCKLGLIICTYCTYILQYFEEVLQHVTSSSCHFNKERQKRMLSSQLSSLIFKEQM
jgi:hypothetical protein